MKKYRLAENGRPLYSIRYSGLVPGQGSMEWGRANFTFSDMESLLTFYEEVFERDEEYILKLGKSKAK